MNGCPDGERLCGGCLGYRLPNLPNFERNGATGVSARLLLGPFDGVLGMGINLVSGSAIAAGAGGGTLVALLVLVAADGGKKSVVLKPTAA